jgi:hypothetical protein
VSAPIDTSSPVLAVLLITNSVRKEESLLLTGSRETRRCKCSSRLLGARTGPKCSASCQRPLTRLLSHHPHPTLTRSLGGNDIGAEGATALAAILKETKITILGCAAAREFAFVSMPALTLLTILAPPSVRSLKGNRLGPEVGAALAEGLQGNSTLRVLK